jgi:hypothetical protein
VIAITVWAILKNHRTLSPLRSEMSGHTLIAAIAREVVRNVFGISRYRRSLLKHRDGHRLRSQAIT